MAKRAIPPGPRDERGVLAARILTAARDAFADTGCAGTTIRSVARAAGVDPALPTTPSAQRTACSMRRRTRRCAGSKVTSRTWTTPVPASAPPCFG